MEGDNPDRGTVVVTTQCYDRLNEMRLAFERSLKEIEALKSGHASYIAAETLRKWCPYLPLWL